MVSLDDVRSVVSDLGLLSEEELSASSESEPDPSLWLDSLTQSGKVTPFQQAMILAGNSRRLRLGDYRLESRIGAGGMGEVFLGYQPSMDRNVAIKVLDSRLMAEPELVQRFEREVKLTGKLLHAHVVTAFDAGHDDGRYFLVMEYVEGASLDMIARGLGPMSVMDALCCGIQAAQGLAYAHANGIVHRDVKPGNLLLSRQGVVKVLDLGLARFREAAAELQTDAATNLSQSGHMLGTVDYLSPEQALDPREADERSDIYSLGCTLCRLLTGSAPYPQGSMMQRILAHRDAPVPSLKDRAPSIPDAVVAVIEKMLAKRPEDRYASMNEVAEALRQSAPRALPIDLRPTVTGSIDEIRRPVDATAETVVRSMAETSSRAVLSASGAPAHATTRIAGTPPRASKFTPRKRWIAGAAGVLGLGLVVLATIVLRWDVEGGTVLLEVHAPNAQVLIDGQQRLTVTDAGKVYRVTADAGTRRVTVRLPDGTEIFGRDIEVQSGRDTEVFDVEFVPDEPPPIEQTEPTETASDTTTPMEEIVVEDGVLTVSQSGSAQYQSIGEALRDVQAGETIRVVDDATYNESLVLQGSKFEGVTIEAVNDARLVFPLGGRIILIIDVPKLTLRGFHLAAESVTTPTWCCLVAGHCPGCVFEDLRVSGLAGHIHIGISIEKMAIEPGEDPLIVRNCRFETIYNGLRFGGMNNDLTPARTRGALVMNNRFVDNIQAVRIEGMVLDSAVVGNIFERATLSGVQIQFAFEETSNMLIANNTFLECVSSIRVWERSPTGTDIQLINNLSLDPSDWDWLIFEADNNDTPIGPGDGPGVHEVYRVAQNWREDDAESEHPAGWIPPSDDDVRQAEIEVLSRDADDDDYLRPAADSALATAGAGYSALPPYVGAVPPEGVEPWDWQQLFARDVADDADRLFEVEPGVVTVSQSGQSHFDAIGDALRHVQPGETIHVLDDAVYNESLIVHGSKFEGVTLEAVDRATISYPSGDRLLLINNVPRFTLRGFHLDVSASTASPSWCCVLHGNCAGTALEDLRLTGSAGTLQVGISFEGCAVNGGEEPIVVRRCRFESTANGVNLGGEHPDNTPLLLRGVLVADNDFVDTIQAIRVEGLVQDAAIVGNRCVRASYAGVQLQHAYDDTGKVLVANNTFMQCESSIRVWESTLTGDFDLMNNLTLDHSERDWFIIEAVDDFEAIGPGDGPSVLEVYRLSHNWREDDADDVQEPGWIPPAGTDIRQAEIELISRDENSTDYLRPAVDSPLATGGIGDEGLPGYVGAVPPEGVEPWEWTLDVSGDDE